MNHILMNITIFSVHSAPITPFHEILVFKFYLFQKELFFLLLKFEKSLVSQQTFEKKN